MKDFQILYEQYGQRLYQYALYLSRNSEQAEELVQETFYRAIKGIHKFNGNSEIYTWLCKIMKNYYLDCNRHNQRIEQVELEENLPIQNNVFETYINMLDLQNALGKCSDIHRDIFIQYYVCGISLSEIAKKNNKSESWARVNLFRARVKLKEYLEVK